MRTSDFDYPLPGHLIAQEPLELRDSSRLLVLERGSGAISHRHFFQLPEILRPGDLLVFNDSRVIRARLLGRRPETGGQAELLLLRRQAPGVWWALVRPARRLRPASRLVFDSGLEARILERGEEGMRLVELSDEALIDRVGKVPLPPYIRRPLDDLDRYQTVYARAEGSVAAPTAGLHFTPGLLERLREAGVEQVFATLHVGLDTFRPVAGEDPLAHKIHTEFWELSLSSAEAISRARREGRRILAVGTTSVRLLEQAAAVSESRRLRKQGVAVADESGRREQRTASTEGSVRREQVAALAEEKMAPGSGWADLFILPGYRFRVVNGLLTNFHLPRSTLLMLVCAFAGRERVLAAYQEAAERGYRFYSFGDAMLVL